MNTCQFAAATIVPGSASEKRAYVVGNRAVEQLNILRQVAHKRPGSSRFHARNIGTISLTLPP